MAKYKHIRTRNLRIKILKKKRIRALKRPGWAISKTGAWKIDLRNPWIYRRVRIPVRSNRGKRLATLKRQAWERRIKMFLLRDKWNFFYKFPCGCGVLQITTKRRNLFITVAVKKKPKATISAGILNYKGRKKTSPFVKERLGAQMGIFCRRNDIKLIDLVMSKKARRSYRPILKGFAKTAKAAIRGIMVRKLRGHGYVRPKKRRRI